MIQLLNINKEYPSSKLPHQALRELSLDIKDGEFIAVVGVSGSGKSTLLRIISGLEIPSSGHSSIGSNNPKVGFVFQQNTIFPWFTIARFVGYPLKLQGVDSNERAKQTRRFLELVGLDYDKVATKHPHQLSGGEQRRVAIAMNLAMNANVLLLDEPTSSLDDLNKWSFQEMIQTLWLEKKFSCVMVTHDIEEALFLASRIIVLKDGRLLKEYKVDFPYPRNPEIRLTSTFNSMKLEIIKSL